MTTTARLCAVSISAVLAGPACGQSKNPVPEAAPPAKAEPAPPPAPEAKGPPATEKVTIAGAGFKTPESILHDADADVYLVSNINGSPLEADNNGFISRVTPDGSVETLRWIEGGSANVMLSAPKGMTLAGDTLLVTDITVIRKFDRKTGAPRGVIAIEGSSFLNDLATGPDGAVYVSDTGLTEGFKPSGTDAVYRITLEGGIEPLIKGKNLGGPNGLVVTDAGVWVATFRSGELFRIADGQRVDVIKPDKGQLDGLVLVDGQLLVSSWAGQSVLRGPPQGPLQAVIEGVKAPADIGFDARRGRVLIPLFEDDAIESHPLGAG